MMPAETSFCKSVAELQLETKGMEEENEEGAEGLYFLQYIAPKLVRPCAETCPILMLGTVCSAQ